MDAVFSNNQVLNRRRLIYFECWITCVYCLVALFVLMGTWPNGDFSTSYEYSSIVSIWIITLVRRRTLSVYRKVGYKSQPSETTILIFKPCPAWKFWAKQCRALSRTKSHKHEMFVTTDRYKNLRIAIRFDTETLTSFMTFLVGSCVVFYCMTTYVLTENPLLLVSQLLVAVPDDLDTKLLYSMIFHSQTNRRLERLNQTIVVRLQQYVIGHLTDWDQYGELLTSEYSGQIHSWQTRDHFYWYYLISKKAC